MLLFIKINEDTLVNISNINKIEKNREDKLSSDFSNWSYKIYKQLELECSRYINQINKWAPENDIFNLYNTNLDFKNLVDSVYKDIPPDPFVYSYKIILKDNSVIKLDKENYQKLLIEIQDYTLN